MGGGFSVTLCLAPKDYGAVDLWQPGQQWLLEVACFQQNASGKSTYLSLHLSP